MEGIFEVFHFMGYIDKENEVDKSMVEEIIIILED